MPSRSFETLLPRILASAPGCPNPTALQHIRDAAIRVCERTTAWRYQPLVYNLLPGVHEYLYQKPDNTDVHVVFGALLNNSLLDLMTLEQAIKAFPAWADLYSGQDGTEVWSATPSGAFNAYQFNEAMFNGEPSYVVPASIVAAGSEPKALTQLTPDKYIVLPLPDAKRPYSMRMFLGLKPKRNATSMDEAVFDDLEDAIFHCALQHLLALPSQNWMDLELASYHAKQYLFHVTERRARANHGNMRGTLRVQNQRFGV
jgi:hypothetical protein